MEIKKLPKKRGPKGPSRFTTNKLSIIAKKLDNFVELKLKEKKPIFLQEFGHRNRILASHLSRIAETARRTGASLEFWRAYMRAKQAQEFDLAEGAATNRYDPGFSFRTLKNVAGWRDEQHLKGEGFEKHSHLTMIIESSKSLPLEIQNRISELKPD